MKPLLTIAIPTFNRNEIVSRSIDRIRIQITEKVRLLIVDNHSDLPISIDPSNASTEVMRNVANVGGNGNILKCFELCESDWIWVLGDDDEILEGAIAKILSIIENYPDYIVINFSTSGAYCRNNSIKGVGRLAFLKSLDNFGNLLFISSNIFNRKKLIKHIDTGYHYAYSCAPHLAMLVQSIGIQDEFLYSTDKIVKWERPIVENRGSLLIIGSGLPTLLELQMTATERKILSSHLSRFPNISSVAHQCFLQCVYSNDNPFHIRKQMYRVISRMSFSEAPLRKIEGLIWHTMLIFPRFFYFFIVRPLFHYKTGIRSGPQLRKLERL